jgi:hypothetical protein
LISGAGCASDAEMSIESLKEELARLSPEEQGSMIHYLVRLRRSRDPQRAKELAAAIDNTSPEEWLTLDELKARLEAKWAEGRQ